MNLASYLLPFFGSAATGGIGELLRSGGSRQTKAPTPEEALRLTPKLAKQWYALYRRDGKAQKRALPDELAFREALFPSAEQAFARWAPQAAARQLALLEQTDPGGRQIRAKLNERALEGLTAWDRLTPTELMRTQQSLRAAQVARGVSQGNAALLAEATGTARAGRQMAAERYRRALEALRTPDAGRDVAAGLNRARTSAFQAALAGLVKPGFSWVTPPRESAARLLPLALQSTRSSRGNKGGAGTAVWLSALRGGLAGLIKGSRKPLS
jgi:hypothetical protein